MSSPPTSADVGDSSEILNVEETDQSPIGDTVPTTNDNLPAAQGEKRKSSQSPTPETKRVHADADFSNSLSRREIASAPTPSGASVYSDTGKAIPAWMKSKAQNKEDNKYDKYGGRRGQASSSAEDRYAKYATSNDRYSKYGAPRSSEGSRVIRRETDSDMEKEDSRRVQEDARRGQEDPRRAQEVSEEAEAEVAAAPYTSIPTVGGPGNKSEYRTFHSSITHKENRDINSIVRAHYNQRTHQSKLQGSRTRSPIYKLRNFNNAIKYILLGNFVKRRHEGAPLVFVDLCCGKGGDLNKCEFVHVDHYIGIDISDASVKEAYSRYSQNKARFIPQNPNSKRHRDSRRYNFEACFATGDLFTYALPEILEPNFPGIMDGLFPVDAVSIQFSFHYAWETESKVRQILTNVTRSLRPGGTFIGTIPSSDFIRDKVVKKEYTDDKTFGNSLYHVKFENDPPEDGVFRSPFGNKYDYFLKDAVDDVPEYVVPFEYLRLLCEDFGLILKYKKNFIDIFNLEIPNYFSRLNKNLVDGMKRADGKYGVEGDEKEAVAFYIGFVFEKLGN